MEQKFIPHPEYVFDPKNLPDTEDAVILIDKPAGISSFGVVAKIRGALKQKFGHKVKVGHTGTLDPFATGLLILLSGKMTKESNDFLKKDKIYEATLKLGYTSSTGDPEGEISEYLKKGFEESVGGYDRSRRRSGVERSVDRRSASPVTTGQRSEREPSLLGYPSEAVPSRNETGASDSVSEKPSLGDIELALQSFIGEIEQTPPRFSAIKINGQRAYKLARKGEDFEIPSRKVKIYSIEILDYNYPELKIRCHVSSGTYIRTLAEDIGKALKTGAYLTALRRLKIADYSVEDASVL